MALRGERYETIRMIASGGMATVYLGRALGAGGFERLVAIKVMHPHLADEAEFIAMFLDEARLAARIRHPNVVSTLDVQKDEAGVFLVMDYVEGPTLSDICKKCKKNGEPLPLGILLRVFIDALAGLHAAHELTGVNGEPLNLVHRDVSPQNILVGADGITRITDFGVARAESRLVTTAGGGNVKGKLSYMSPEQIRSEPIDRRTDVYAAGVVMWEALTNQRLMHGENQGAIVRHILAGAQQGPSQVNAAVPQALNAVCMRALRLVPAERFAAAAEFAEAIEVAAQSAGVEIASQRVVAGFVTELKAHASPIDLPPSSQPARVWAAQAIAQAGHGHGQEPPVERQDLPVKRQSPAFQRQLPLEGDTAGCADLVATTHRAVSSDSIVPDERRKVRSSRPVFLAMMLVLGGGALCAGVAGWWFLQNAQPDATSPGPAAAPASLVQAPAAATAPPAGPSAATTDAPAAPSSALALEQPAPSASNNPIDPAPGWEAAPSTDTGAGRAAPGRLLPSKASPPVRTAPTPTVYRPSEL